MTWQHGTCVDCRYADTAMANDGPTLECHRQPPVSYEDEITPPPDDSPELQAEYGVLVSVEVHRYPRVREHDWCGEWRELGS